MMLGILSETKDVCFNLALEEFFLRNRTGEFFILWQSEKAVVVGKHQNTLAEINSAFTRKHKIPIARRLSGGGTVVHGPGNLNFTFIMNGEPGRLVNFRRFVTPVILFLKTLGLDAEIGVRNDLLICGKKISGNAEHVFRQRVLHHGTLLFDADLTVLKEALKNKPGQYLSNAVKSNPSDVANISSFLTESITFEVFMERLFQYLQDYFGTGISYRLKASEHREIEHLRKEKYHTDGWIYGYSPAFEVEGNVNLDGQPTYFRGRVVKGIVTEMKVKSESSLFNPEELEKEIIGVPFDFKEIKRILGNMNTLTTDQINSILDVLF